MTLNGSQDGYRAHPAASMFPDMSPTDYKELVDSIKARGLLEPIVRCEGMVLDGRQCLRACIEAGVEPRFVEFDGDSPAEYVWARNYHRRHLTVPQRAAAAYAFKEMLAKEANRRQSVGGRIGGMKHRANLPHAPVVGGEGQGVAQLDETEKGRTRDRLAQMARVSPRTIQDVQTIAQESPELFEQVRNGERTVNSAMTKIRAQKRGDAVADEKVEAGAGGGAPDTADRPGTHPRKCKKGDRQPSPEEAYELLVSTEPTVTEAMAIVRDSGYMPADAGEINEVVNRLVHTVLTTAAELACRPGTDSVIETLRMETAAVMRTVERHGAGPAGCSSSERAA